MSEEQPPKEIEELPPSSWREKYIKNWLDIVLGRRAWMLEKHQRQDRSVRQISEMTRTGKVSESPQSGGDGVGVNVGNETHHHYSAEKKSGGLAAAALAVAALVGTGGIGAIVGGYLAGEPVTPHVTDTDTWREFDLTPGKVTEIPK